MPTYGVTAAGFVAKPTTAILANLEAAQLATMDTALDLSPTGPQGQLNGIVANALSEVWQLAGVVYNSNNRQAVEGAGLDNIGDEVGVQREGESYTRVLCTLVFSSGTIGTTFAAGSLVANVSGSTAFTFANLVALDVTGTTMSGVVMQAQVSGATASVNPGTLTVITNPVAGWTSITNPLAQSQLGANAELDALYAARQEQELAIQGSCNAAATVAALVSIGAAQSPPVALQVTVLENRTDSPVTYGTLTVFPHSFAPVVYDVGGWAATTTGIVIMPDGSTSTGGGAAAIGATVWANSPDGITSCGARSVVVEDPNVGEQTVYYTVPTSKPLYFDIGISLRPGFDLAPVSAAIKTALIEASTAATPSNGVPPAGQLPPGQDVYFSQERYVVSSVAGVLDVPDFYMDFFSPPTDISGSLPVDAAHVATIDAANIQVGLAV